MFVDMIIRYYVQKFNTETQFNRVLLKIKSIKMFEKWVKWEK